MTTVSLDNLLTPQFLAQDDQHLVTLAVLDLSAAPNAPISTVEVARVGDYTDAKGQPVHITTADLDALIGNFTAQAAGQDVPIDVMHEKREAGGWLRRVWREGEKLLAEVAWNKLGAQLVGDQVYRYLSASIAMPSWVLRSVSLVNFPAIKGLAPVELSEWLLAQPFPNSVSTPPDSAAADTTASFAPEPNARQRHAPTRKQGTPNGGLHMADPEITEIEEIEDEDEREEVSPTTSPAAPVEYGLSAAQLNKIKNQAVSELMEQIVADLSAKREEMMTQLREEMEDERQLSEFALSATATGAHALPVDPSEIKAVLGKLPRNARQPVIDLLTKIVQAGTIDMGEHGTSAAGDTRQRLDPQMGQVLRTFLNRGSSVTRFFQANPELGAMEDYDLSEFGQPATE